MDKIGHFFRWIFLDKESNTWKEYCLKNGLIKEEPKEEEPKTIVLEKSAEEVKKSVEKEVVEEAKESYNKLFPKSFNKEWTERCEQVICNYTYDCDESKTAVADLLNNNRDTWYIVSTGLNGKSGLITEALEYLTKKKWEFLGEVESSVYGWRVDYSKMLDKDYENNI